MSKQVALVTGAGGEMGHLLLPALRKRGFDVVALDLIHLPDSLAEHCKATVEASINDVDTVETLIREHSPLVVFHLAAILSTKADNLPDLAHQVNVQGTVDLFRICRESAEANGRNVRFLFPSSIAAYGLPGAEAKEKAGSLVETEWNQPYGVYGCNKIYGELLGRFWSDHATVLGEPGIDFRAIRFPGLISAETVPSGGTSDYGPEMLHAAVQGVQYSCFVREDTRLPFMTMPDAVEAFIKLSEADPGALATRVYNIRSFSPTAGEFREAIIEHFPEADIRFEPDPARQAIVDSWPLDVDDTQAKRDWKFHPEHGFTEALRDYLIPALRKRYAPAKL